MANGHNDICRLAHRTAEELYATRILAGATSWPEAVNSFRAKLDIQIMNRNGYQEPPAVRNRLLQKHETVLKYLEGRFGDFYAQYDYSAKLPSSNPALEGKVWMCWWQGLDSAPEVVQACVDSVQRNVGDRDVVVITDNNLSDYVDIPGWVFDKVKDGIITRTNLSDLLRLSLLTEHGGLWLDATFYCAGPIESMVFATPLWTIKRPDYLHASVAGGNFAGYSLACDTSCRKPFMVVRDFFLEYWRQSTFMIDYLLVDYLIVLAQRHCPAIADAFESVSPNNPLCDELIKVLGEPFNPEMWSLMRSETKLFKLTWKQSFPRERGGKKTFYGALLDGDLS
jgi:hypothetical protein